ncbi:MAG: hypothetical protein ABIJ46_02465 [bacterium]
MEGTFVPKKDVRKFGCPHCNGRSTICVRGEGDLPLTRRTCRTCGLEFVAVSMSLIGSKVTMTLEPSNNILSGTVTRHPLNPAAGPGPVPTI